MRVGRIGVNQNGTSDERYYEYMGRRLREEEEKELYIEEEHTHTNGYDVRYGRTNKMSYY